MQTTFIWLKKVVFRLITANTRRLVSNCIMQMSSFSHLQPILIPFHFFSSWMIHMERQLGSSSGLKTDASLVNQLDDRCRLLMTGLSHAQSLSNWITTTLNICAVLSKPMSKSAVLALCRSVELLKAIDFTFHRHSLNISKSVNHVILHLMLKAAAILEKCHLRAKAEKRSTRRHEEILAAFQVRMIRFFGTIEKQKNKQTRIELRLYFSSLQSYQPMPIRSSSPRSKTALRGRQIGAPS